MKPLQLQGGSGEEGILSPGLVITQSNEKRKRRAENSEDAIETKPVGQVWEPMKPRGGVPSPITRWEEPGHRLGVTLWVSPSPQVQGAQRDSGGSIDCVMMSPRGNPAPCH